MFLVVVTQAFRTVVVQPGQTVCVELVASWPGPTVVEERIDGGDDDDEEYTGECAENYDGERSVFDGPNSHRWEPKTATASAPRQKQNRAVLFAAAVPYAAVRAAYECKVSAVILLDNMLWYFRRSRLEKQIKITLVFR